ncbi:hypothetical protein AWC38_SpisGene798 [Stylophora pistillata]|uniref:Uncharacterized protein n=1 Tax=Stylophora pistillata TaxID=50429 RepID=A0A2B4T105_STYPI|nr:hypothetical protein AWC38_SpisGene798 [Stylophora pistillata]
MAAWNKEIFVSPHGNDSWKCRRDHPCKSIDRAFGEALNGSGANSTRILVKSGNYTMAKSFNFTRVDTFALAGDEDGKVRITCEPHASISFVLCENIIFERIQLQRCGGWRESPVGANNSAPLGPKGNRGVLFRTVLDFRYCRNARFTNVEVSNSPGVGINFFNVGGVLNLTNCVLADNKGANSSNSNGALQRFIGDGYVLSGGGVILTLSKYGDNVFNVTPSQHDSFQHNNSYIFSHCTFLGNEAFGWNISKIYDQKKDPGRSEFSLGAGLAINFKGNASDCQIQIQFCSFIGNKAVWGGGLNIKIRDEVKSNHFMITNTSFCDNSGKLAGGGVRIGNLQTRATVNSKNTFIFDKNCTFTNNEAIWGGGMSLYGRSIWGSVNTKTPFMAKFNLCIWRDNRATVGSAIAVMLDRKQEVQIEPGIPFSISFKDCTFAGNQVVALDEGVMIGEGALYSDGVTLNFQGKTLFINNTNTTLSLDGSVAKINDHVEFMYNRGYRGGAIAMRGYSKIIFQKNSNLYFYKNSCEHKGGALYIETPGSPMVAFNATGVDIHDCFFGYEDEQKDFQNWETSVLFEGNEAVDAKKGNSVYATTLQNCRQPGESPNNNKVLKWKFIHFKTSDGKNSSRKEEVATDAVDILFDRKDWEVAPGEVFNAKVQLVDEINNTVVGIVNIHIDSPDKAKPVKLGTTSSVFLTDGSISFLSLAGEPGSAFTVVLHYMGRELLQDKIKNVSLQGCHPGFVYDRSVQSCICMKSPGIIRCDLHDKKTVYLKKGYWAGKVDHQFTTHLCPDGYCTTLKSIFPAEYKYNGTVCKYGRNQTSVLCGQCKPGYTVMFASEQCSSDCTNRWLWMIIVYLMALIAVSFFVLLVNPNLSGGHLNACLYSYQIMKILPPEGFIFDPFIEFLTALSNIQLGVGKGVCFAAGLSNVDKLAISALFPIAEILLILPLLTWVLIKTWKRFLDWIVNRLEDRERCFCRNVLVRWLRFLSDSFERRIENGFDHAYCTIVVLCYVDITNIALRLLHFVRVGGRWVLFDDGNVEFFDSVWHGIFVSGAILLMLFVLYITLRLAIYPAESNLRLETLHACFKPGYRSFVAYYLVCRLVLLGINTFMRTSALKASLLLFFCIFFMFVVATVRPYTERNHGGNRNEALPRTTQSGNRTEKRQRSRGASRGISKTPASDKELTRVGAVVNEVEEEQTEANEGNPEGEQNLGRGVAENSQQAANHYTAPSDEGEEAERPDDQKQEEGGQRNAGQEIMENLYINESDLVILMTLSAIAVFSIPTNIDVSESTRHRLQQFVRILAYVPLVMALLPYMLFYLRRQLQCYRHKRREHHGEHHFSQRHAQDISPVPPSCVPERSAKRQDDRLEEQTPLIGNREDTDSDHRTKFYTAHSSPPISSLPIVAYPVSH